MGFRGRGSFLDLEPIIAELCGLHFLIAFFRDIGEALLVKLGLSFIEEIVFGLIFSVEIGDKYVEESGVVFGERTIDET